MRSRYTEWVKIHTRSRNRQSGSSASTNTVAPSVMAAQSRNTPLGCRPSPDVTPQNTAEETAMPTNDSRLPTASTAPFRPGSGRCCMIAETGTMKKPPKNPRIVRYVSDCPNVRPARPRNALNTVRPIAPSGTSPYSIFPPDR